MESACAGSQRRNNDSPNTAKSDLGGEGADDDVHSDPAKGTEDRAD